MNGHSDRLGCQVPERRTGEKGREATYGHLKLMAASVVTGIRQALLALGRRDFLIGKNQCFCAELNT